MENVWIQANVKFIEGVKRTCLEHDMKGGYGGTIPLQGIIKLFDSAIIEIRRLQRENDNLNNKNKDALKIIEESKEEFQKQLLLFEDKIK